MDKLELPKVIKTQAIDYVTAGTRAALGSVPFAGSLLAEVAGSIIPNQRIDRIADFATQLQERIVHLEEAVVAVQLNDEEFTDLVEESIRQASRSTSDERRSYLASLIAHSLSSAAVKHADSKHLMRMLGELNDVEVLWLRFFSDPTLGGDEEFRVLHADVFEPRCATLDATQEELDASALQDSYKNHLLQIGLLEEHIRKGKDGTPEFDKFSGKPKVSYTEASSLGHLLLRSIGMVEPG
jgi:hypothetical protein